MSMKILNLYCIPHNLFKVLKKIDIKFNFKPNKSVNVYNLFLNRDFFFSFKFIGLLNKKDYKSII